jgi:hypothetical protein
MPKDFLGISSINMMWAMFSPDVSYLKSRNFHIILLKQKSTSENDHQRQ